jgi:Capsular polysaccharide synthesis protein
MSESSTNFYALPSIIDPPDPSTLPHGLVPISPIRTDLRTDAEISTWLSTRHAVTSDKNIWAFWHSGFLSMRPWCRRNIINWVRRLGPDWTVHVVDCVPGSETNVRHFVPDEYLPDAFLNGIMDGPSVGPHSGDIVRLPLLWLYGGVWLDAGTLLFRHVDDICWRQMEDPNTPFEMAGFVLSLRPDEDAMINGFIASKRNNPFIKRWHDIYAAMWAGGVTNADGFHKHPLLRHLPLLNPPLSKSNLKLDVTMESFTDYLAHFVAFERLRKLIDPSDGFNGPEYYRKHILFAKAMEETFYVQPKTKWSGPLQFSYLTTRRTGEAEDEEKRREARDFVHDALANSSTMKLSHGHPGGKDFLADLWDQPENEDADCRPGTFAEYLRWGSVHLDQTREMVPYKIDNSKEKVYHIGVLEPAEQV